MSREETVQECDHALEELLPELPRPEQKALAAVVSGVVVEETVVLTQASAGIPGEAQERSKQRRAQRLLANPRLEVSRAQRRGVERVLQGRCGRLPLLLDATIVRTVLVPAAMKLLGGRNWYLPSWLQWLPGTAGEGAAVRLR